MIEKLVWLAVAPVKNTRNMRMTKIKARVFPNRSRAVFVKHAVFKKKDQSAAVTDFGSNDKFKAKKS